MEKIYGTVYINGEACPVTNLIDALGEETDDVESAITAVAKFRDDKWIVFDAVACGIYPVQ